MHPILERLKERKLVQWALAYAAGAWVVLEVVDLVGGQFDWPRPLLQAITLLTPFGLCVTLVVAWYHGEKGRQRVSGPCAGSVRKPGPRRSNAFRTRSRDHAGRLVRACPRRSGGSPLPPGVPG